MLVEGLEAAKIARQLGMVRVHMAFSSSSILAYIFDIFQIPRTGKANSDPIPSLSGPA